MKVTVEHRDEEAIDPFLLELEVEGTADAPDFRLRAETAEAAVRGRMAEVEQKAIHAAHELGPCSKSTLAKALGVQRKVALGVVNRLLERHCLTLEGGKGRALERSDL